MRKLPPALPSYEQVESILSDERARQGYDDTKMHWMGDPDPARRHEGRNPWVKRVHGDKEYTYSLPVVAAFSIARNSLVSIRKDPWHEEDEKYAWFVGIHNLETGKVTEPEILSVDIDAARCLRLQVAGETASSRYGELLRSPRDQRRLELYLDNNYHADQAEYRVGLRLPAVRFEDITGLESMMRVVCEAKNLQLPHSVNLSSAA